MEKGARICIKFKNKKVWVSNVVRAGIFGKFRGLMFRGKNTSNILFDFIDDTLTPIHSYFVFFSFLAVWLDGSNNVLEFRIVRPFTSIVRPKKPFRKLIELPLNSENMGAIGFFVGKRKI